MNPKTETFQKARSAAEAAKCAPKPKQVNPMGYDTPKASDRTTLPTKFWKEHETVPSRLGGKAREISFGPLPNGLVPANPFASIAQEGYLHAHPEKLGAKGLAEWDASTKGKSLPEHVKK
jgi:hypothetical protein